MFLTHVYVITGVPYDDWRTKGKPILCLKSAVWSGWEMHLKVTRELRTKPRSH